MKFDNSIFFIIFPFPKAGRAKAFPAISENSEFIGYLLSCDSPFYLFLCSPLVAEAGGALGRIRKLKKSPLDIIEREHKFITHKVNRLFPLCPWLPPRAFLCLSLLTNPVFEGHQTSYNNSVVRKSKSP